MKTSPLPLTILFSVLLASQHVVAHEAGNANQAYVGMSGGHLISDGYGHCVRTGSWREADALADCGDTPRAAEATPETAPAPAPVVRPAPAAKKITRTVSLSAGALFDLNSDQIKPGAKAELTALARHINSLDDIETVNIVGYTDSSGSAGYNQKLSLRRANAVKDFLMEQGVPLQVMTTLGKGEEDPVADNHTAEGRAKNRRVEITLRGSQAQ